MSLIKKLATLALTATLLLPTGCARKVLEGEYDGKSYEWTQGVVLNYDKVQVKANKGCTNDYAISFRDASWGSEKIISWLGYDASSGFSDKYEKINTKPLRLIINPGKPNEESFKTEDLKNKEIVALFATQTLTALEGIASNKTARNEELTMQKLKEYQTK